MYLTCITSTEDNNFIEGNVYEVAINHPHLVSLIGEDKYKMNFTRREDDLNLPYIWNYFDIKDKYKLDSKIEKLK